MPLSEMIPGLLLLTAAVIALVTLIWAILRPLGRSRPPRWRDARDSGKPRPAPPQPEGERLVPRLNAETIDQTWTPPRRTADREEASSEDILSMLISCDPAIPDHKPQHQNVD